MTGERIQIISSKNIYIPKIVGIDIGSVLSYIWTHYFGWTSCGSVIPATFLWYDIPIMCDMLSRLSKQVLCGDFLAKSPWAPMFFYLSHVEYHESFVCFAFICQVFLSLKNTRKNSHIHVRVNGKQGTKGQHLQTCTLFLRKLFNLI